jgi:Transposase DDE domain.
LEDVFTSEELISTAKETGFCRRESKLNPFVFFDLMMYDSSSAKPKSLNQLAIEALSGHDIGISKQGMNKRFNEQALAFIKQLIEKQLSVELGQQIEAGWLSLFNRVLIKDATRFELPEKYKDQLPGSGGSASKAGACLQFEYDLKSGNIIDLNLTAANRPDVKDAVQVLDNVECNDLIIRDLGYFAFSSFLNISSKGGFFVSRVRANAIIYEMKGGKIQQLDFKVLYERMKKHQLSRIEKDVFIGNTPKIPVRMIIDLLPDAVYEERIRKTNRSHKRKGYNSSEKFKLNSRFNLIITNVSEDVLPTDVLPTLYRIRWQIELIFKIWKSIIGIHHNRNMKYTRWLCILHFKLLLMIVNWNIVMGKRNHIYMQRGRLLSLNKCFKTLFDNSYRLRDALKKGLNGIVDFIKWVEKIFRENHWLERKKKKIGLEEICYLYYCKSNIYVYI